MVMKMMTFTKQDSQVDQLRVTQLRLEMIRFLEQQNIAIVLMMFIAQSF